MNVSRATWSLALVGIACALASRGAAQRLQVGETRAAATDLEITFFDGVRACSAQKNGEIYRLTCGRNVRDIAVRLVDSVIVETSSPDGFLPLDAASGIEIVRPLFLRAGLFLVRSLRDEDPFQLSARLWRERSRWNVRGVTPDYALPHARTAYAQAPNDPNLGSQWYLSTIHMLEAWRIETGSPGIQVGVVDNGCDLTHPDLVDRLETGFDAADQDDDPSYFPSEHGNEHGTACAGLIAATGNNNIAIAGMCPECRLQCIRLLPSDGADVRMSADVDTFAYAFEQDLDVLSNSWGYVGNPAAPGPVVRAIRTVLDEGRAGLGAMVVFAVGNDGMLTDSDTLQGIDGVISVGGINAFDEAVSFSNRSRELFLTAPVGTYTLDISGPDGDNDGDTTRNFGGTSSAAPIASGVIALALSHDPTQTRVALTERLQATLRRAPFATAMGRDTQYGFGILDAAALLQKVDAERPRPASTSSCAAGRNTRSPWMPLMLTLLTLAACKRRTQIATTRGLAQLLSAALLAACARAPVGAIESALRPTANDVDPSVPHYGASDAVTSYSTTEGHFRVHYAAAGRHAPPALDTNANQVPDYVEEVAAAYERVRSAYLTRGFREPVADDAQVDHGGDARFDVYLIDFGGTSDGAYRHDDGAQSGFMLHENDFSESRYPSLAYAHRLLSAHEYFHAIQSAYGESVADAGVNFSEGTATFASELVDPSLEDLEDFTPAFLQRLDRSLAVDPIGPPSSYSYGMAALFAFASAQTSDAFLRKLVEARAADTTDAAWTVVFDQVLQREYASSFARVYAGFVLEKARTQHASLGQVNALPYGELRTTRLTAASTKIYSLASTETFVRLVSENINGEVYWVGANGTRFDRAQLVAGQTLRGGLLLWIDTRASGDGGNVSFCLATEDAPCVQTNDAGADASPMMATGSAGCSFRRVSASNPRICVLVVTLAIGLFVRRSRKYPRKNA